MGSWNLANVFIRNAKNPKAKDKRRYLIAGLCVVGAFALLFVPYGWVGSIVLVAIAGKKVFNAKTDDT